MHNTIVIARKARPGRPQRRLSKHWTPEDDARLIELIGRGMTAAEIALAMPPRSGQAIRQRSYRLEDAGLIPQRRKCAAGYQGSLVPLEALLERAVPSPDQERLMARCRQLADVLKGGGMTYRGLLRAGWTAAYVEDLVRSGPRWFDVDVVGVALTHEGRTQLLGTKT